MRESILRRKSYFVSVFACVLALCSLPAVGAGGTVLGQMANSAARLDGNAVPSGTTIFSPSLVEAAEKAAIVHLANGQILALEPGAATRLEATASGGIVAVGVAGRAYVRDSEGLWLLAANSVLTLAAAQPQRGQANEVRLCVLEDATAENFQKCTVDDPDAAVCDWELLVVPASQASQYLGVSAVTAGTDNNDLGLDNDCEEEAGAGGGGLATGAKVGIGVGSALATFLIIDQVDDDDEPPASPITP